MTLMISTREHGLTVLAASTIRVPITPMAGHARRPLLRDGRPNSTPAMAMDESELLSSPITIHDTQIPLPSPLHIGLEA